MTLEDLFEEVVGEIDDRPERRSGPRRDSSGRLRVPGTMRLDELGQQFDLELAHEDVDSVSGLILRCWAGRRRSATRSITTGCICRSPPSADAGWKKRRLPCVSRRTTKRAEDTGRSAYASGSAVRIIIVGGGEIGFALAQALSVDNDVFVVDHAPVVAADSSRSTCSFCSATGTSGEVLGRAGIERAECWWPAPASTR